MKKKALEYELSTIIKIGLVVVVILFLLLIIKRYADVFSFG